MIGKIFELVEIIENCTHIKIIEFGNNDIVGDLGIIKTFNNNNVFYPLYSSAIIDKNKIIIQE